MFVFMPSHVRSQDVKPNASGTRALSSRRNEHHWEETAPVIGHFQAFCLNQKVEAWKQHFPYSSPLSKWEAQNGKVDRKREKEPFLCRTRDAFSSESNSQWFLKQQVWWYSTSWRSVGGVRLIELPDLWWTAPVSYPSSELCDQVPASNLPLFEIDTTVSIFWTGHWQIQKPKETSQRCFPLNRDHQSKD